MQNALIPFDNNDLFDQNGHLTGAGLGAMEQGSLDELGSLEAAEHLSFCNACLASYTNWLEQAPRALLAPARDLTPQVHALLRMRSVRVLTNRYVSAAAAIALAFVLWSFGAFNIGSGAAQRVADRFAQGPRYTVGQGVRQMADGIAQTAEDLLDRLHACVQSGFDQLADADARAARRAEAADPDAAPDTDHQQDRGQQPAKGE